MVVALLFFQSLSPPSYPALPCGNSLLIHLHLLPSETCFWCVRLSISVRILLFALFCFYFNFLLLLRLFLNQPNGNEFWLSGSVSLTKMKKVSGLLKGFYPRLFFFFFFFLSFCNWDLNSTLTVVSSFSLDNFLWLFLWRFSFFSCDNLICRFVIFLIFPNPRLIAASNGTRKMKNLFLLFYVFASEPFYFHFELF